MTTTHPSPPRSVFATMGTIVSLRVEGGLPPDLESAVRTTFERLDHRFSTYRPDSEASAVAAGRITPDAASAEFRDAYVKALHWQRQTDGAFSPIRPDGPIDLSGIVKALAIQQAVDVLHSSQIANWCLNAGGDVVVDGCQSSGEPWVIGLVDPDDRQSLVSQYTSPTAGAAVATSGTSERGDHVWRTDQTFRQVSVVAGDIITADVLATAILAGGPTTLQKAQADHDIEVFAVDQAGRPWASRAFRA